MPDSPPTGYLVARTDAGYGEVFPLVSAIRYTLGRATTNRIPLRDDLCSREHAEVFWRNDQWYVRDLGSLNGTHLNEIKLIGERPLAPDDFIRFGNSRFIFVVVLNNLPTPDDQPRDPPTVAITSRLNETKYIRPPDPPDKTQVVARPGSTADALGVLFRMAVDSAAAGTPEQLADVVLTALFTATLAEVGAVLAVVGRDTTMVSYRTRNPNAKTYHKVSTFVSAEVIKTRQAVLAEDVPNVPTLKNRDSVNDLKAASLICTPVEVDGELLGLVHLYSTTVGRRLRADDLEFSLAAARQLGLVWHRLRRETGLTATVKALQHRFQVRTQLVGTSPAMAQLEAHIGRVASTKTTVLIRGESGVGKELVASAIHANSPRRDRPFICLNCAALTESLLESELFGHEKGAFTGATDRMLGKFESADGGTIFLDEIGEMAVGTQAKLLRVLENQPFERVGGNTPIRVDVRVVAATNRMLEDAVRDGSFRKDLFFRLQVVQLDVPPLRHRTADIPALAEHFFRHFTLETGRKLTGLTPAAVEKLVAHQWPGNVRELRNVLERAVVLSAGPTVDAADIWLAGLDPAPPPVAQFEPLTLEELERRHITNMLKHTGWNKSQAAELLGVERSTLDRKIKSFGLKRSEE